MQFEIRRPHIDEQARVRALVLDVVNETYGSIWPTRPIILGAEDWGAGWVAVAGDELLGWMLTKDDWLDDLWVSSRFRGLGVGSALLRHGEREIAARGMATAHLHVIASNKRAIAFYEKHGWRPLRETPHEIAPDPRLEMTKVIA
jgi:ribosomal protein S18 acetylase RimI-like enzyme